MLNAHCSMPKGYKNAINERLNPIYHRIERERKKTDKIINYHTSMDVNWNAISFAQNMSISRKYTYKSAATAAEEKNRTKICICGTFTPLAIQGAIGTHRILPKKNKTTPFPLTKLHKHHFSNCGSEWMKNEKNRSKIEMCKFGPKEKNKSLQAFNHENSKYVQPNRKRHTNRTALKMIRYVRFNFIDAGCFDMESASRRASVRLSNLLIAQCSSTRIPIALHPAR